MTRAGNHTWNHIQPIDGRTVSIDRITGNLTSAWVIETSGFDATASRWGTTSTGAVKVGRVPWNSDGSMNGKFYRALEAFVAAAEKRDITVVVRLFEGTFQAFADYKGGWANHWSRGLKDGPPSADQVHTRGTWNTYQRDHVRLVAKTLAPYDNVIGHAGNELHRNSISWFQPTVVRWWRKWSDDPIVVGYAQGMKPSAGRSQDWMARTGAEILSPAGGQRITGHRGKYLFDTDHSHPLRHIPGSLQTAHRRGDWILLMDGFDGNLLKNQNDLAPDRAFIRSIT